eukprot:5052769-Amphidinium_carterae.1
MRVRFAWRLKTLRSAQLVGHSRGTALHRNPYTPHKSGLSRRRGRTLFPFCSAQEHPRNFIGEVPFCLRSEWVCRSVPLLPQYSAQMPWPATASSTRTRTPSRGLSWEDQTSDAEETGVSSGRPWMAQSAWPRAAASSTQPRSDRSWLRRPPQWNFSSQDCFHGRKQVARAEGHLADVSCLWLCEDNLEIALTVLADFFPQGPRAFIPVANNEGQRREVPYYGALRWRKLARAVAGADS